MIIQFTLEFDIQKVYNEPDTLVSGEQLAKAILDGQADWPDEVRVDVCKGIQSDFVYPMNRT